MLKKYRIFSSGFSFVVHNNLPHVITFLVPFRFIFTSLVFFFLRKLLCEGFPSIWELFCIPEKWHNSLISRGNKCQFWQIFVEAHEEFPNYFIQSKTRASAQEYSGSNRANKYVMLLSNFWDENRGLSHFSEKWSRHQLALVPQTVIILHHLLVMNV